MSLPGLVVYEAFPFNGPDDPDASLIPVDITGFVNDNLQAPASGWGRQTDLQSVDPGPFTITLNNAAPAFPRVLALVDPFERNVSNDWGTAPTGQVWTVSGGAASDYLTNGVAGVMSLGSVNVARTATAAVSFADFDINVDRIGVTAGPLSAPFDYVIQARISGADFVEARLFFNPGGLFTLQVRQLVAGVVSASAVTSVPVPGFVFPAFRFMGLGGYVQAKVWEAGKTQPAGWTVALAVSHTTAGPVLVSAMLESGNTNGLPVLVDWSNVTAVDPLSVSDLFTPANVLSPLAPGWRTSMRLRMRETIGFRTYTLADGNLLQPAVTIATPGADQTVNVTAVDRIGRLQQGRKLISTLTEWVRYNASGLAAYWPLADAAGSSQAIEATGFGKPLQPEGRYVGTPATTSPAIFSFGSVAGPKGDDGLYPQFNPALNSTSTAAQIGNRLTLRTLGLTVAGTSYALVAWVKTDPTNVGTYQVVLLHDNFALNVLEIDVAVSGSFQVWYLVASTSAGSGAVTGPPVAFGRWQMVAARITVATGVAELWVDGNFTGSANTGGPASGALDSIVAQGDSPNTSVGQVQIYNGGDYTRTAHLAQYAAGLTGLSGQYAGDRIATIAGYAKIPAGELGDVDQGVAMMGPARLAGRTAFDAMRDAEPAEQGLLHARGRRLVFHSRIRRYDR